MTVRNGGVKHAVKAALGQGLLGLRVHRMIEAERGLIVVFHRVNRFPTTDGLTATPERFEEFCRFFSRYFNVVSLTTFIQALEQGRSVGGMLAITFDDGYLDNYEIAAPILTRLDLPATFFVTTRFIGSEIVPWWDREIGMVFPWMNWGQVRALHAQGFEIGAHTRTHSDLGLVAGDAAMDEIQGSRFDLEDQLGAQVQHFAYPYGREHQLMESNRDLVAQAGYRCCCSSYGGSNTKTTSPLFVRRQPISSWFSSPYELGFEFAALKI
jgi:peptidoglycan/xylan/chitin deacetylase (PgdA/CDA1 family)